MKSVTITEIAEKANVSRGTVDRVLNNRPDVSDKTRQKVLKIIDELNYKPNVLAKALKSKEKKIKIGIIVSPKSNHYGKDVLKGVLYAQRECANYGITVNIYEMPEFNIESQIKQIHSALEDNVEALALAPMEDQGIRNLLLEIMNEIPLAFYNTELEGINNICYIGQDAKACGRVAAQLLSILSHGQGDTIVFLGYRMIKAHINRAESFEKYMSEYFPGMKIVENLETLEDNDRIQRYCDEIFTEYDIKNIFISGGGIDGLGEYLLKNNLVGQVNVVCTDYICRTAEFLKKNVIQFAIGQQPFEQGYYPIKILMDYLLSGIKPGSREVYTNLDIRIKENIDYDFSERLITY